MPIGAEDDRDADSAIAQRLCARDVGADVVALDFVGCGAGALHEDPVLGIAADYVARGGRVPAHHVAAGAVDQSDAMTVVTGRARARHVGADVVAQHPVAGRPRVLEPHAAVDQVARAGILPTHHVVAGREADEHAGVAVGQGVRARCVQADGVARDPVAIGAGLLQHHPVPSVAADDVARTGRLPADDGVVCADGQDDTRISIAQAACACRIGADVVAQHPVTGRVGVLDEDAGFVSLIVPIVISADQIARARRISTHHIVAGAGHDDDAASGICPAPSCPSRPCR